MATTKNILIPVDFSKSSAAAFSYAITLARQTRAKLLLVHVITESATMVPFQFRAEFYKALEREAVNSVKKLTHRKKVEAKDYRFVVCRGSDAARLIAQQAAKSRSFMIVMGSQGRTGLRRLILGSVAEKTLRYAKCPILIVKR